MMISSLAQPPIITLIVLCVSIVMSFLSSFINTRFMPKGHRQKMAALNRKLGALRKEVSENKKTAKSTGDKKLLKKVQKQERQLLQLQSQVASMSLKQMRVMPITMGVFFIVWLLLTGRLLYWELFNSPFYVPGVPVAFLPWLGGVFQLELFHWYLICSLLFGTLFSRIFGLTGGTD